MERPPRLDDEHMHTRALIRASFALLAAVVAAALASGCSSGGAAAALDPVANAAETTNQADGARLAMHVQVMIAGLPQQMTIDAGGRTSFKTQEGEISLQMNGIPGASAGGFGEGGKISERFVGGKLFMGSSLLAGKLPGGATWVEIDVAAAAKKLGLDTQSLTSGQSNPAQFLEYLRADGGSVHVTGTARVRGVQTTAYTGTVDLSKVPGTDASSMKGAIAGVIAATGTSMIPIEAWVDSKNLIRRFTLTIPLSADGRRVDTKVTVEFFAFGPQRPVTAPPASETYEMSAAALGGGGSAS
jgi:outer membrane murein-binding lipoprotein Lpp